MTKMTKMTNITKQNPNNKSITSIKGMIKSSAIILIIRKKGIRQKVRKVNRSDLGDSIQVLSATISQAPLLLITMPNNTDIRTITQKLCIEVVENQDSIL